MSVERRRIQLRGGTAAEWTAANPVLAAREPGVESDTGKQKIGDGVTAWSSLPYSGGSGGGGATNLAASPGATTVAVTSSTGTGATIPAATTSNAGVMTAAMKAKLDGVASGATANAADAALRDRGTHTGSQPSTTISDFTEAVQDVVGALLGGTSGVTVTYNDAAGTVTIAGGGAGGLDAEAARDTIGAALLGVGVISVTVNDAADTITISSTATTNSTDASLRDRSTHTGSQTASTISDFAAAADARVAAGNAATATKLATARALQTNLASTSAVNFDGSSAASPGVTGTLSVGNGGTGATSAAGARTALGLDTVTVNTQTGTAYTLALTDANGVVEINNASPNTVTVPPNSSAAFGTGTVIELCALGAGQTTVAAGAGVTIRSAGGKLKLTGQYSGAALRKRGTDEWVLVGDLSA